MSNGQQSKPPSSLKKTVKQTAKLGLALVAATTVNQVINKLAESSPREAPAAVQQIQNSPATVDQLRTILEDCDTTPHESIMEVSCIEPEEAARLLVTVPCHRAEGIAAYIQQETTREADDGYGSGAYRPDGYITLEIHPSAENQAETIVIQALSTVKEAIPVATALLAYETAQVLLDKEKLEHARMRVQPDMTTIITLEWKPRAHFSRRSKDPEVFVLPRQTVEDVTKAMISGLEAGFVYKVTELSLPTPQASKIIVKDR